MPTRPFWTRLGFGTIAGDAEEARLLVQRRLALYVGGVCLMWLAISVVGLVSTVLFMPELLGDRHASRASAVHNGGLLALAVIWVVCRRGRWSLRALGWFDAGTTIGFSVVMSTIMDAVDLRFRPDLSMALGLSTALIGRAAVVPSRGGRTLAVGALAALPVLIGAAFTHAAARPRFMPPAVPVMQIATWMVFAVLLSTTVSRVIYGLSQRVAEAARLGQYTLERKIGEGAMGVVYLARHALLRRPTAIKLLRPDRAGQHALQRFEREVQTTSALRHPNTVAIYDYGRTPDGVFYYAMEYLDGIDLQALVDSEGPLPQGRAVRIVAQIARALDEAHGAGLIHRDVKPSNVLLCDLGHQADFAKVLDFGLVRVRQESDDRGADPNASGTVALAGTPLYLSPEAITDPAGVDARADLYALGGLAYTLLTGAPPFGGGTTVEVCAQHLYTPAVPPSQRRAEPVSPPLEALVMALLAKDRAARPQSAAAVAEALDRCDVPPWTDADARAWWRTRGAELRAARAQPAPRISGTGDTVAVDLEARAR